jgi:hypothetical protein
MSFEKKYLKYKKKYLDLIKLKIGQRYKTSLNLEGGASTTAAAEEDNNEKKRILILSSHQNKMTAMIYNLLFNNNDELENYITRWKQLHNKNDMTKIEVLTQFGFDNYGTLKIDKINAINIRIQIIGGDRFNFRNFFSSPELILPMNTFPENLIVYIVRHGEANHNILNTKMIEELENLKGNLSTLKVGGSAKSGSSAKGGESGGGGY